MSFVRGIKKGWTRIAAIALVVGSLVTPMVVEASSQPRDCNDFSIMWCGAYTKSEFMKKMASGDGKHSSANLKQIYYYEGRGITEANFKSSSTVDGVVMKDGRVVVNGKTVATDARSVGRTYKPGSTKSGSVWERPDTSGFLSNIPAWVHMEGGTFKYFILKSCGNPGRAVAVAKPKPSPTPTPSPTPKPKSFECVALTPSRPDAENKPARFRFTITPKTQNVTVTGYRFTFSDNTAAVDTAADKPYTEREVAPGTLTVHGYVKTNAGTTEKSDACSAVVTVTQATPSPTPTPQVLGAQLPVTGPELALGGIAGLSAMGWAGRAYLRSRKSLLDTLRHNNTSN